LSKRARSPHYSALSVACHHVLRWGGHAGAFRPASDAAAKHAKEETERAIANRTDVMEVAQAQARLAEAVAQLQALERLRKNLKH
jgi:hypothetical protein